MFLAVYFVLLLTTKPSKNDLVFETWTVLENSLNLNQHTLPGTFNFALNKPGYVKLQYKLSESQLALLKDTVLYFYLPKLSANYLEIHVDERIIGSFGCASRRTGYIWYEPLIFMLPKNTSNLTIYLYGISELGINQKAFLTYSTLKYSFLGFLTGTVIKILIGVILFNGLMLLVFARNIYTARREGYFFLALANLFIAIWMFRNVNFQFFQSEFNFLVFRRFFLSSSAFGFAFLSQALSSFYYSTATKLDKFLLFLNLAAGVAISVVPNFFLLTVLITRVYVFIILLNAFFILYKSFKSYSTPLFLTWSFFAITLIADSVNLLLRTGQRYLSPFSLPLAVATFSYNIVIEFKDLVTRVHLAHARSITDPLTGAYNRGVLNDLVLEPTDTVVFIDLNDLKKINDFYGHDMGDQILKTLVSVISSNIRSNDVIVRMGGDEFMAILKNCPEEKAKEIMEEIAQQFANSHALKPTIAFGVKAFSKSLTETIRLTDTLMYQMKYRLKSQQDSFKSQSHG